MLGSVSAENKCQLIQLRGTEEILIWILKQYRPILTPLLSSYNCAMLATYSVSKYFSEFYFTAVLFPQE